MVTSNPGGVTASGTASPITVSGLTNGTSYTFMVVAVNGVGNSLASAPFSAIVSVADRNLDQPDHLADKDANDLVAHYRFDTGSGNRVIDSSRKRFITLEAYFIEPNFYFFISNSGYLIKGLQLGIKFLNQEYFLFRLILKRRHSCGNN